MIQLTNDIWIGDSYDERYADLVTRDIGAVLNVAVDLPPTRSWKDGVTYMQVGLVDGPGNPPSAYQAAVLALEALIETRHRTLVCCHTMGRSMAVALMYMGSQSNHDWEDLVQILTERLDVDLPVPHEAHKKMFRGVVCAASYWRAARARG